MQALAAPEWGDLRASRRTPAFQPDDFLAWLSVDYRGGLAPATVAAARRRLAWMEANGLVWSAFFATPDQARDEARRLLARVPQGGEARRNYTQTLNQLAAFRAQDDRAFERVRWLFPKKKRTALAKYGDDEIARILAYRFPGNEVVEKRRRALVWMAWATGLRRGELGDLRLSDLDAKRGTVRVGKPRKDGKRRELPLPDDAWSDVRPLQAWLKVRPVPTDGSDWLWTTTNGGAARRMNGDTLYNDDLWAMRRDLGVARLDFRRFRHYKGKTLAKRFVPLQIIQEALGHASPNSTRVYMEDLDADEMAEAFRRAGVPGYGRRSARRVVERDGAVAVLGDGEAVRLADVPREAVAPGLPA